MIMHIDLNSCFAIIEQQANRLLRGRPVGVAAYDTPRGFIVAASYEAKAQDIKLGVNVEQSRALAPGIVIMTPDPAKYREAHRLFKEVLLEYSPDVTPKSIDEFVLNMDNSPALREKMNFLNEGASKISGIKYQISESQRQLHNKVMLAIGEEIKTKIHQRLGEWVTVNIGIATNRFLAKYAAGFDKPNGITLIDHVNLRSKYENMNLVDLPGINTRYRARLRIAGIYTPLDFLDSDLNTLKRQVFKGIVGYYWYLRLRGHEIDALQSLRKSIGHQHALSDKTTDIDKLERLLIKLCEKTGRRLRKNDLYATGIHLFLGFVNEYSGYNDSTNNVRRMSSWHHSKKIDHRLYTTTDIYEEAKRLLHQASMDSNYGACASDSFGASGKNGTRGITIPRSGYWTNQAKNIQEPSSVSDFVGEQAGRRMFRSRVKIMSVHVFGLLDWHPEQLNIFDITPDNSSKSSAREKYSAITAQKRLSDSVDEINTRYGEFVITPAMMLDMQGTVLDRIAFGQVRDM